MTRFRQRKRIIRGSTMFPAILISSLILAFSFPLCLSPKAAAEDVIRFGASLSLTGKMANEGRLVRHGYDYYVKHINAKGGIPIKGKNYKVDITYYDDESDPNTAARLVEKLIVEDKVHFLLGPYSSTCTFSASSVAEKYKMPMVAAHAASTPIFERGYKYIFVTLSSIDQYFGNVLKMAAELSPRPETVALINENTLAPQLSVDSAEKEAKRLGFKVVYKQKYPSGTKDLSSMLAEVGNKRPDILLSGSYTSDSIIIVKQAKEMGVRPKIFGLLLGPTVHGFAEAVKTDGEHLLEPIQWSPNMSWKDDVFGYTGAEFARIFEKEYGFKPDYHPPQSTAALLVYHHALQKAGVLDPQRVRDAIAETNIMTFYGPVRFDERGMNIAKGMAVVQIQEGRQVVVFPKPVSEGKLIYPIPGSR